VTVGDVSCAMADDADGGPPALEKSGGALRRASMVLTVMRLRGLGSAGFAGSVKEEAGAEAPWALSLW
jgi:hypothetical protein